MVKAFGATYCNQDGYVGSTVVVLEGDNKIVGSGYKFSQSRRIGDAKKTYW